MAHLVVVGPVEPIAAILVALPEAAVVADVEAVVGVEDHRGVLGTAVVDLLQQSAHPGVHQGHLAGVEGARVADLRLGGADLLAAGVRRVVDQLARVPGIVQVDVVLRRIPRLVRIEAVHPEEELVVRVVELNPVGGVLEGTGGEGVAFGVPVALPPAVVVGAHPLRPADLLGRAGQLHLEGIGDGAVDLLAAVPLPPREAAVEAVTVAHQVRSVGDQHGHVARLGEQLADDRLVLGQRRPTPVGVHPLAGDHVGAVRDGWEGKEPV